MPEVVALIGILGALLIGAISPGPSFVLVSRLALARSRRDGIAAALGMGLGGALFGTIALLGLNALLVEVPWLNGALKLIGGGYLLILALRIWRGAAQPLAIPAAGAAVVSAPGRSFVLAFVTQISNPKTAVVYAGIFAALLPAHPPFWMLAALPPLICVVEASWYVLVALAFSANRPRALYLSSKRRIDRCAGAVMGALGARLVAEAVSPR
ncbi:LysE family translocator [Rhodospirillum rubrum]|uniref:Lysine exporter protein (LYSE/YGGA) n=1 Tax=Rhodospirillum rubrum (strain ATCC 11170 / ATH 1.1.1 / DSM 467 / LMG 4362 / NCIMB 8255 / S1) TaxID=269796 RepID=Q2RMY9_RHORT|nr:LysE family translocator [Rhodospirillum rubrum]ABC24506.1 Lysine exporter protein (LYSE/YGGA) [Rhodospirillum rubrum ATCC 11170]AEO50258.1 lysine exporter protein LysE/YggA [Rhodospirillum rubrum F11]MBK5956232.1 threonine transporter [Rhodospirillum rubrum]QXG80423.1 LysE family translocator [Rhodospirillum rubrum]HAP99721.1 threonine transporter [Rhodospirillum rubrum]